MLAGWLNRQQQDVIAYLIEENRTLRTQLGGRRVRLTDARRRSEEHIDRNDDEDSTYRIVYHAERI